MNKFIIGLVAAVVVAAIVYFASSKSEPAEDASPSVSLTQSATASPSATVSGSVSPMPTYTPVTKLVVQTMVAGTGPGAKTGDTVDVAYKGMLVDGRVFDQGTYQVKIGTTAVIKGWTEGLIGIKKGEKRLLIIPPDMAYGSTGVQGSIIGPNATLVFEVEALKLNGK